MKPSELYKSGDIIFVFGTGLISRLIGLVTFGKATHACLVVNAKMIYETDGAWRKSKYSQIDSYDSSKIRVYRIKSFTDLHRKNLISVCDKRLGTWYSYWDCFVQGCLSFLNPKISERIASCVTSSLVSKCDEETQICHNLARGEQYFKFPGGKNPQILMEELAISADADLVLETA